MNSRNQVDTPTKKILSKVSKGTKNSRNQVETPTNIFLVSQGNMNSRNQVETPTNMILSKSESRTHELKESG